jgi:hypothetical protein
LLDGEAAAGTGDVTAGGPGFGTFAGVLVIAGATDGCGGATGFAGAGRGVVLPEAVLLGGMAPGGITPVARI